MTAQTPKLWTMPGGIHPPENKLQSLREAIRTALLPQRLVIALTQPGYVKPEILVAVGDVVRKGQLIARGDPAGGLSCHASTSGVITAITELPVPNASGLPELCAVLESDGRDEWLKLPPLDAWQNDDPQSVLERIAEAGISGLGGAGFPSHTKIRGALHQVHTLIINACECEPFITADAALMREQAVDIVAGIGILLHLTAAPQCLIGIEDNKPEAIAALQAVIDDPRIRLVVVPTQYPSGAEKQLIYILTGLEIPAGSLAVHSGILCHNVGTARAITRAVVHGEALVARVTTLTGAALGRPGNLEVLIGTPIADLLRACEVDEFKLQRLINGGALMGMQLPHADLPVLKTTNCIIAATLEELPPPEPQQACIRCGYCAEVCPVNLLPQQLFWFARSKEFAKAQTHNLFDCIECGACAYVCPSYIPLVQYYRATKADIRAERAKQRMAEYSKTRYEFHQARKAEENALEQQRRAERAALAKQNSNNNTATDAQAAIAAAMARVKAKKAAAAADTAPPTPPASEPIGPAHVPAPPDRTNANADGQSASNPDADT